MVCPPFLINFRLGEMDFSSMKRNPTKIGKKRSGPRPETETCWFSGNLSKKRGDFLVKRGFLLKKTIGKIVTRVHRYTNTEVVQNKDYNNNNKTYRLCI